MLLNDYLRHFLTGAACALLLLGFSGCSGGLTGGESGYILPERLELRSSTAKVSSSAGEVKRGDEVKITERITEAGNNWVKIDGPGGVTGWTEARNVVSGEIVGKSRQLAEAAKDVQAQAVGRSKASLKLRLTPDRSNDDNVATTLGAGTMVEILGRERRPRPQEAKTEGKEAEGEKGDSGSDSPQYDLWLKVRLKDNDLLPVGYLYGGSVELEVPAEIMYFVSSGRRIVGWQKINAIRDERGQENNNYLVVERQIFGADETTEFDRILVLAYDPGARSYFSPFREDIKGRFPVSLKLDGNHGGFYFTAFDKNKQEYKAEYTVDVLEGGKLKIVRANKPSAQAAPKKRR